MTRFTTMAMCSMLMMTACATEDESPSTSESALPPAMRKQDGSSSNTGPGMVAADISTFVATRCAAMHEMR
jgi:hypothetical protein